MPDDIELPTQAERTEVHVKLYESAAFDYARMRATGGASSFGRDDLLPAV